MSAYQKHIGRGVIAALFSATMLGMAPIFGKLAINAGMDTTFLVVLRTTLAALALWVIFGLFARQYLYIYPVGLVACFAAGAINGIGSLMFYASLNYLSASLSQLIYATNPIILALLLRLDGQPISKLTGFRLILTIPAVFLITYGTLDGSTLWGVLLMLGGSIMYALHLAVNQRALSDIPAPTVTLYTLTSMALVVVPSILFLRTPPSEYSGGAWGGLIGLMVVTLLSRLTLFMGVKRLGGMQTALLGLSELVVSLLAAYLLLGDTLTPIQWLGAVTLSFSMILIGWERDIGTKHISTGWLAEFYQLIDRQPLPNPDAFDYQALLEKAARADAIASQSTTNHYQASPDEASAPHPPSHSPNDYEEAMQKKSTNPTDHPATQ